MFFSNQLTSIPSNSGIVSTVSTSVLHQFRQAAKEIRLKLVRHMGLAPGPVTDVHPPWLRRTAQPRFGDSPGAGGVSQDDQWQDPEESVEDPLAPKFRHILIYIYI